MFELVDSGPQSAIIKVIGVGGGGGNAIQIGTIWLPFASTTVLLWSNLM